MRLSSILSFTGFVLLFAGTYCPLLRPFYLFSWNVYKINQPYGLVLLLIAIVGIVASFLNQVKITRIAAGLSFALVVLLLVAALLKVQTAFSFIPFPKVDAFLSRQIKFRWGWWVLFAGPVIALAGALSGKPKAYIKPAEVSS